MLSSYTAVVARNIDWSGQAATDPYEAGWAQEAVLYVRALRDAVGQVGDVQVEMSADGIHWLPEGTSFRLPTRRDEVTCARVRHFGNWLRLTSTLPEGASLRVLVTYHLKG